MGSLCKRRHCTTESWELKSGNPLYFLPLVWLRQWRKGLTRLSKKSGFGIFTEKSLLKIKGVWAPIFSVLGFFHSLNPNMQATANSLRSCPALAIRRA